MRYVFVSDIHGQFDKLMEALHKVHFNPDADTIVSLGDPFDRGPQSWEVLEFLMSCPNRILVWGNHDLRLRELLIGADYPQSYDKSNGMLETLCSFCGTKVYTIGVGLHQLKCDDDKRERCKLLWQYFDECVYAVEWSDLVGTHAWIPVAIDYRKTKYDKWGVAMTTTVLKYDKNWRSVSRSCWNETAWGDSQECFTQRIFIPNKTLIIGHWHAWRLRRAESNGAIVYNDINDIDFSTFVYKDKLIAIDGCTNVEPGLVNTYIYETNEAPTFITA